MSPFNRFLEQINELYKQAKNIFETILFQI